jgi:hypothetical protein
MNPEIIVAALLADTSILSLIGTRSALSQLPQNTAVPAIVYDIVSSTPTPIVAYASSAQLATARIQFNVLAKDIPKVKEIHSALRTLLDFRHNSIVAGKRVMSCRLETLWPMEKDNEAGFWIQPADYMLRWYE